MDRFWTVVLWILILAALIGVLRYGKEANNLARTILGWILAESQLLAGLAPSNATVPAAK